MLLTRIHLQGSSNSFDSDIATIRVSLLDEVQFSLVCRPRVSWPFTFFPFICTCNTAEKNIMKNRAKLVLWPIISYCEACLQLFQFAFCLLWCACDTLWSGPTLIVFTMRSSPNAGHCQLFAGFSWLCKSFMKITLIHVFEITMVMMTVYNYFSDHQYQPWQALQVNMAGLSPILILLDSHGCANL